MGITIMPGPAVHKDPGATAATVHHQAIVQVGVARICRIHIRHPCQVPFGQQRIINRILSAHIITHAIWERPLSLPVEVIFLSDPAGMPLSSDKQQVE